MIPITLTFKTEKHVALEPAENQEQIFGVIADLQLSDPQDGEIILHVGNMRRATLDGTQAHLYIRGEHYQDDLVQARAAILRMFTALQTTQLPSYY